MRAWVPTWSKCQRACVPAWFTCQQSCVLAWFTCQRATSVPSSHFYMPTCQKACQRAIRHANISTWHANVLNGMPIFQLAMSTCQRAFQFFKHSSYEMLREISIFNYYLKNPTLYLISHTYTYYGYMHHIYDLYYTILFETFLLFR